MPFSSSIRDYRSPESYRWTIALLLGVGVLVNYFDRVNLSVSHDALVTSFGITPATFGQLSAAYSWTYAACQLPTGVILDMFGVRKVSLWSIFIWGLASVAAAFAPGVIFFFAARLLLGVGEAPTFPANAKAVGAWFPASERSLATAMFDSAAKLANAVGVPLLGLLLLRVGWRMSFGFTAALSFSYLLLFALVYREPHRFSMRDVVLDYDKPGDPQASLAAPLPLGLLMRQRKIIGLAIGSGSYNYVFYLLLTWLPTYLAQSLHISLRQSFLFTGAPWLFAAVCGLFIGGFLVDGLIQRGYSAPRVRRVVLVGGTVCGLGIAGAIFAHSVATRSDSHFDRHRRPVCRIARPLEHAFAAGAKLQHGQGRWHHEFFEPALGHCRPHHHRPHGAADTRLHVGIRHSRGLPGRWHPVVPVSAGPD